MTVDDWRVKYEILSAETDRLRAEAERDAARAGEARALEAKPTVTGETSDGYHTFNELYEHRITLWVALCRVIEQQRERTVWKTQLHSDGTGFDGWFVLGMYHLPGQQITYHLPMSRWDECRFQTLDRAPEFDGHTGADVLARLERMND
jgi:hypothetical protein